MNSSARLWSVRMADNFWLVPGLMALAGVAAAVGLTFLDRPLSDSRFARWAYAGDSQGAIVILSSLAGAVVTVTGVAFSITILTLSLASNQFGTQLLSPFLRDKGSQIVLGILISTVLYCVFVLRTIQKDEATDVPRLSTIVGILMAAGSLCALIYFLHHVSHSIQASTVTARLWKELRETVTYVFPDSPAPPEPPPPDVPAQRPVRSERDGYVEAVDEEDLVRLAERHGLLFRLEKRPGDFVRRDEVLLRAGPAERTSDLEEEGIRKSFHIGPARTPAQDVFFVFDKLLQMALRALSPAVNDPFTAILCIDRIEGGLALMAVRAEPRPVRTDDRGAPRLIQPAPTFAEVVEAIFTSLRTPAASNLCIALHVLRSLSRVAAAARRDADREVLRRQADLLVREAVERLPLAVDRERVALAYAAMDEALR